jgi:hypothetical protein
MYKYNMQQVIDPEDPDYGLIYLERELIDPTIAPGATILAETEDDESCWQLDVSAFPDVALWKVRIPVSGKGYTPRMRIVSYNELEYELLNFIWVFRTLNSR